MRILMIGGTRFIGPCVARRLVRDGHEVAVFHRGVHNAELPSTVMRFKSSFAQIPVTHIPDELVAYAPDVVVHMIAMGERDAEAARDAFVRVARRMVVLSSGDVYRAYGVFKGLEPGSLEPVPISESSPLRSRLYPYRTDTTAPDALEYLYDTVVVEKTIAADPRLPVTILRLPKVYGPGDNANLATVYGFCRHPHWRWTHGFVENVAKGIVLAAESEVASGRTYNVGEEKTPTVAERLQNLPARSPTAPIDDTGNFAQDIAYDTTAIRRELGFCEDVPELDAMRRLCLAT